ncbi:hypothetical protein MTO96_019382 [Rhipicephalus appendiculatus]
MIIKVGTVTMVLLFIIDAILLYFWLTSTRTKYHKTVTVTVNSARRLLGPGLYPEDGEDSYLLLEEISPNDMILSGWQRRQHMCNTAGCLWLRDYLRRGGSGSSHIQSQRRSPPHPCDDFHEHVCGSRQQSIYEDGVSRLMDAVKARLLGALRRTAGKGSEVLKGASERKWDKVHARLLQRCLDGATVVTEDDITSACGSIRSMVCPNSVPEAPLRISEGFFQNNPNASVADYAAFLKSLAADLSWKTRSRSRAAKTPSKPSSSRSCERWFQRGSPILGPNVTGLIVEDDPDKLRADTEHASQRLGAIEVHLLEHDDADATLPPNAQYVAERKTLLVPLGLLGVLLNTSSIIEPVLVPALGREVMRVLMPTSRGPYAWRSRNERHFRALVDCVASDLDTEDAEEALAERTTLESALLEPLMVLYKRRLQEELGRGLRLHGDYGNAELFVLWALNHCGQSATPRRSSTARSGTRRCSPGCSSVP